MVSVLDEVRQAPGSDRSTAARVREFRPDVEGLRAVAVVLVVLYHAGAGWLPGGYVGVDVFFVISGFLITSLLLREYAAGATLSFADFYARRARRILPLASLVVVATIGASAVLLTPSGEDAVAHDGIWTSVFAANFHFADVGANYLSASAPPSPLQHFWSLAVEEQFYVLWPAVLLLALKIFTGHRPGGVWRVGPFTGVLVALSLYWSVHETARNASGAYFSPITRAWELGVGALIAVCATGLVRFLRPVAAPLGWAGIVLVCVAAVRFDATTPFPGHAALLPVTGAACVIAAGLARARGGPDLLLATTPMRLLGGYSYSLYLWHWPILVIAEQRYPGLSGWPKAALVAIAVLLSVASYTWFENSLRRSRSLVHSRTRSLLVGLACIAATLAYSNMVVVGHRAVVARAQTLFAAQQKAASGASVETLASDAQVRSQVAKAVDLKRVPIDVTPPLNLADRDASPVYRDGCLVDTGPVRSPVCVYGNRHATRTVVLLGDSHAAQWLPALSDLGGRRNFRVVVLTKHSCPVADVRTYDGIVGRYYHECVDWRSWALLRIEALHPQAVIASETLEALVDKGGHQIAGSEAVWQAGLSSTLATLSAAAGHVYLLSDTPQHASAVPGCLQQFETDPARCVSSPDRGRNGEHQRLDRATARASGADYVDTSVWFCTTGNCPAIVDGKVTMFDDNHMTATYSSYLSHVLGVATGLELASQNTTTLGGLSSENVIGAVAAAAAGKLATSSLTPPPAVAASDHSPAYDNGCLVEARQTASPTCVFGATTSASKVVLFGDSHAAQWMPALIDSASRAKFALTVLAKGNCPAPEMTVYNTELRRPFHECDTWRTSALDRIAKLRPQLVVVSSTFHGQTLPGGHMQSTATEAAWDLGLVQTILRLRATGARVVMLSDVAGHAEAVPACIEAHPTNLLACATPAYSGILLQHRAIERQVVTRSGAAYVDVVPWFCTQTVCPAAVGGIVTDFDDSHLTATYSRYLGHALGVALGLES